MKKSQAKKNFEKGSRNQYKSKQFMLNHPLEYGILDEGRVVIVRAGIGSDDFFSVVYDKALTINKDKKAKIDPDGDTARTALLKLGFYMKDLKAGFDIISIPFPIPGCVQDVFLVQVKTNKEPGEKYMQCLKDAEFPSFVKKEMHIWIDGNNQEPKIIKL